MLLVCCRYCPLCKNDATEVVQAGEKLKESKKKSKMASAKSTSNRDWGKVRGDLPLCDDKEVDSLIIRRQVTHICVSKLTIIGADNGLSPSRHQAIIRTNAGILLICTLGTNFSGILSKIHGFSFKKMHFKRLSAKSQPFCLGFNVLTTLHVLNCIQKNWYWLR